MCSLQPLPTEGHTWHSRRPADVHEEIEFQNHYSIDEPSCDAVLQIKLLKRLKAFDLGFWQSSLRVAENPGLRKASIMDKA